MSGRWGQSGYSVVGGAGGSATTAAHIIQFAVGTATATSALSIPAGNVAFLVSVAVGTAYTAGATLAITCGATSLLPATAINAQFVDQYVSLPCVAVAGGVVTATVAGGPAAGAATVTVAYATPNA